MGKLWRGLNHLGFALAVFLTLTVAFLWATGSLRLDLAPSARSPEGEHGHTADDGHEHGEPEAHAHEEGDEHGVPESACTRCNPALVAAFKAQGDWCSEHGLPESHCEACNPGCTKALKAAGSHEPDLEALAKRQCEHGRPILTCDECRYQVGAVKLEPALAAALLKTAKAETREATRTLRLTGEVQLDRTRVVDVPPAASGRIVRVLAVLGQRVERGQALAVVHSGDFGEAKAAYLSANVAFEIAHKEQERQTAVTAALDRLLARLAENDGPAKEAGQLHGAAQAPGDLVGELKAKLVGAAARLRRARLAHEREKGLAEKGVSSQADHEEAHHEWEAAEAEYAALVEEVRLNLSLDKLKAANAARQAEAALRAAEQRLHILGLDEAALSTLREQKDNGEFARLEVKAPRAGTVTAHHATEGRLVETTDSLFTIADLSNLWVWCDVYERDLAALHDRLATGEPLPAVVRVAAFGDRPFPGAIDLVGSEVDEHTRTVKARVQVPNPDGRLRPGMFAHVEAQLEAGDRAALVPREAILSDEGRAFVFQQVKDDLWLRRDVATGRAFGDCVEIVSGLPDEATVAISGGFMLKSDVLRNKMGAG